jgi:hypothetical protein
MILTDTVILIVTMSHQLNDMTFDESLNSRYGNDIAYCEQPPESDCDNHWCNKEHILLMMTLLSFFWVSVMILALTHKPQSKPIQR